MVPSSPHLDLFVIDEMLTALECDALRVRAREQGFGPARLFTEGRVNEETFLIDPALADLVLARLEPLAPIREVDDLFEVYRYRAGHHITLHKDSSRRIRGGHFSNSTLLVYLNDVLHGGRTLFKSPERAVSPARGRAVLFGHGLAHEAECVLCGEKYVVRASIVLGPS